MIISSRDIGYYLPIPITEQNIPVDLSEYDACVIYFRLQGTDTVREGTAEIEDGYVDYLIEEEFPAGRYTVEIVFQTISSEEGEEDELLSSKSYFKTLQVRESL